MIRKRPELRQNNEQKKIYNRRQPTTTPEVYAVTALCQFSYKLIIADRRIL